MDEIWPRYGPLAPPRDGCSHSTVCRLWRLSHTAIVRAPAAAATTDTPPNPDPNLDPNRGQSAQAPRHSLMLHALAARCGGLSGRALRKLPFLAQAPSTVSAARTPPPHTHIVHGLSLTKLCTTPLSAVPCLSSARQALFLPPPAADGTAPDLPSFLAALARAIEHEQRSRGDLAPSATPMVC